MTRFVSVGHLQCSVNTDQLNDNMFADIKDGKIHLWNRWTLQPADVVSVFIYFSLQFSLFSVLFYFCALGS